VIVAVGIDCGWHPCRRNVEIDSIDSLLSIGCQWHKNLMPQIIFKYDRINRAAICLNGYGRGLAGKSGGGS
jgi:hypothetical protein